MYVHEVSSCLAFSAEPVPLWRSVCRRRLVLALWDIELGVARRRRVCARLAAGTAGVVLAFEMALAVRRAFFWLPRLLHQFPLFCQRIPLFPPAKRLELRPLVGIDGLLGEIVGSAAGEDERAPPDVR
jgi:hypothetical protein